MSLRIWIHGILKMYGCEGFHEQKVQNIELFMIVSCLQQLFKTSLILNDRGQRLEP
nr:MAG TPA: hypothetical protein [Caudoviricetes sp.]